MINIIELRRQFHKIPELGFKEFETSTLIKSILRDNGIQYTDSVAGTGLIVSLGEGHPHIAFRAEMDALPIMEENSVDYCSKHDGCMHACGHDCHLAGLIATAIQTKTLFESKKIKGKVTFIFQPCEETTNEDGLSGGQIISSLPFIDDIDSIYTSHIESTLKSGKIFVRNGALTAAIDRFDAEVIGKAGHGAYPHNTIDPIWLTANVIQQINSLESRVVNTAYPSVISVCTVNGGKIWNAIPEKVALSGTIRTFNQSEREKIHSSLKACFETVKQFNGDYVLNIKKGNPSVINNIFECESVRKAAAKIVGLENVVDIEIQMGGDDFSHYSLKKPSCYYYIGAKKDEVSRQHHSGNFDIDESKIDLISQIYIQIIKDKLL